MPLAKRKLPLVIETIIYTPHHGLDVYLTINLFAKTEEVALVARLLFRKVNKADCKCILEKDLEQYSGTSGVVC